MTWSEAKPFARTSAWSPSTSGVVDEGAGLGLHGAREEGAVGLRLGDEGLRVEGEERVPPLGHGVSDAGEGRRRRRRIRRRRVMAPHHEQDRPRHASDTGQDTAQGGLLLRRDPVEDVGRGDPEPEDPVRQEPDPVLLRVRPLPEEEPRHREEDRRGGDADPRPHGEGVALPQHHREVPEDEDRHRDEEEDPPVDVGQEHRLVEVGEDLARGRGEVEVEGVRRQETAQRQQAAEERLLAGAEHALQREPPLWVRPEDRRTEAKARNGCRSPTPAPRPRRGPSRPPRRGGPAPPRRPSPPW